MYNNNKYHILEESNIDLISTRVSVMEHIQSGAKVVILSNQDENCGFGISFATASYSNTGVAHILEHCVLCGSSKYPIKEVFGELMKGSVNTFINAFTYPDKTLYPFTTTNTKDYLNLAGVYLDCVFFPTISREMFEQEGRHIEYDKQNDCLFYKGVVYNEMKGVYSTTENYLFKGLLQTMLPDTVYAKDYGGDPLEIPLLDYEQFKQFHANCYHPSNATIFIYGNVDLESILSLTEEYLDQFQKKEFSTVSKARYLSDEFKTTAKSQLSLQSPFDKKQSVKFVYCEPEKSAMAFAFNAGVSTDTQKYFEMTILNELLTGKSSSPLRRALEESGLGEEFWGGDPDPLYEILIVHGLKGVKSEDLDKLKELYFKTLENISELGFEPKSIQSILDSRLLQFVTGDMEGYDSYPRAIKLFNIILGSSNYNGSVVKPLMLDIAIDNLKGKLIADPKYLENLIRTELINNANSAVIEYVPSKDLLSHRNSQEQASLKSIRQGMSDSQLEEVVIAQEKLLQWQKTPDSKEALATIPVLSLKDISKTVENIEFEKLSSNIHISNFATNKVNYIDIAIDLKFLPYELIKYLPLFARCLGELQTRDAGLRDLQDEIGRISGGVDFELYFGQNREGELVAKLLVSAKSLDTNLSNLFDLIGSILQNTLWSDHKRLGEIILSMRSGLKDALVRRGNRTILTYLNSELSPDGKLNSQTQGWELYNNLLEFEKELDSVSAKVQTIARFLNNKNLFLIQFSCDKTTQTKVEDIERFLNIFPDLELVNQDWPFDLRPADKSISLESQVSYIAQSFVLPQSYQYDGSIEVISKFLNLDYLWRKIRIQGGAYGAVSLVDPDSLVLSITSYRDPNPTNSFEVCKDLPDYLQTVDIDASMLNKAIISAVSAYNNYIPVERRGRVALLRYSTGRTTKIRQSIYDQILQTDSSHFVQLGQILPKSPTIIRGILSQDGYL